MAHMEIGKGNTWRKEAHRMERAEKDARRKGEAARHWGLAFAAPSYPPLLLPLPRRGWRRSLRYLIHSCNDARASRFAQHECKESARLRLSSGERQRARLVFGQASFDAPHRDLCTR